MAFRSSYSKPIRSFNEIIEETERIVNATGPKKVALAVGEDVATLRGLALGKSKGWIEPVVIGRSRHIRYELETIGESPAGWEIIDERDAQEATRISALLTRNGKAEILMRGKLLARDFFTTLFEPELNLRTSGALWTNIVVLQIKGLERLVLLTDCALTVDLDLPGRLKLIQNATEFAQFLGVTEPKISLLAAVETVTPGMPVSLEEAVIAKMCERGQFPKGVSVDGPLSLDLSLSRNAVAKKKMQSHVAGAADILVVDSIPVGNLLFKSLITLCDAKSASVIVGPAFPIIITSRSEPSENILNSIALSILMANSESK